MTGSPADVGRGARHRLVVTPAAAAARLTASAVPLALGSSVPISAYVTTISFTVYAVCRRAGGYRVLWWGR